ncbi:MAG TPA: porin [Puia sp.]|nr:porin [Puia sp.]
MLFPLSMYAQKDTLKLLPDGTDGLLFAKRPIDTILVHDKKELPANEFEGTYSTFRIGMGYIGDVTAYGQSATFKRQMDSLDLDLKTTYQTRDFRVLGSGRLLKTKRYIAWKFAYMYDGDKKVWMIRETGVTIGVPELSGNIFIGRTKEGFSMIKVMNGHSGLTNERQMALDPIPILADGIKYFGYFPKSKLFLNLGYYNDFMSKGQSFSTFRWQTVARVGWVPVYKPDQNLLLHVAANLQYGDPVNGQFSIKSRPESNPTPQLISTGTFSANHASDLGMEAYFTIKRFTIGSEVMTHNYYSNTAQNHNFYGGDVVVSYFLTNNERPYNTTSGNVYGFVPVKSGIFNHGIGAIEAVLHISTFNLNNGDIHGGQFTRITPMINWYLAKFLRMEFIYGYGILDRFNLKGSVNFFESRLQVTLM